jgi:siroheme synthase (precorrin-2 oxidase/ferrochelatase)
MATMPEWQVERLKYKTPKERARINDSVPVEQRLQIVDERKMYEDSDKLAQIQPKFTEESRTYSVVSSLAFFFGSPVGAELTNSGTVAYKQTAQGLIKWRIDEFFKSREINDVMTSICDVVLSTDDEELINRVHDQIKKSNALSDRKKKSVNRFFDKLFKFRKANQSRRNEQLKAETMNSLQMLPEEERKVFLQSLGITTSGPIEMRNVSGNN